MRNSPRSRHASGGSRVRPGQFCGFPAGTGTARKSRNNTQAATAAKQVTVGSQGCSQSRLRSGAPTRPGAVAWCAAATPCQTAPSTKPAREDATRPPCHVRSRPRERSTNPATHNTTSTPSVGKTEHRTTQVPTARSEHHPSKLSSMNALVVSCEPSQFADSAAARVESIWARLCRTLKIPTFCAGHP
jgi:hypothetical protein